MLRDSRDLAAGSPILLEARAGLPSYVDSLETLWGALDLGSGAWEVDGVPALQTMMTL